MIIKRIEIENFRSLEKVKVDCEGLVALVGRNGSGKSSVLYALDVFYDMSASITIEDFYNRDTEREISIRVTYAHLNQDELEEFKSYIQDEKLIVTKKIEQTERGITQRYFGAAMQIPEFAELRPLGKTDKRTGWNELVDNGKYPDIGDRVRSGDAADLAMDAYERTHPELREPIERQEQFFGPKNIGGGKLDNFTSFVHVPAVREATAEEHKKGAIFELIDTIVLRKINEREDVQLLRKDFEEKVADVYSPENLKELGELATDISQLLKQYAPGAELRLRWGDPKVPDIPPPPAYARLIDDGYECPISHSGHGLQRTLILTLLQHLATTQVGVADQTGETVSNATKQKAARTPDLILAIEEPELFLHPARCRFVAELLLELSKAPANDRQPRTQVMYATHSSYFVELDRFDQIRIARRIRRDTSPAPICCISSYSIRKANDEVSRITGLDRATLTTASWRARALPVFTHVVSEGFFADTTLVVEGLADLGVFSQLQAIMGKNWPALGIVIVPANGKENLDRPVIVFRGLEIPTYFVFDGDAETNAPEQAKKPNRRYLSLARAEVVDFPETMIEADWAVFHCDIEGEMKKALGTQEYKVIRDETAKDLGYEDYSRVEKNAEGMARLIKKIYDAELKVPVLEQIVERVTNMRAS